MYRLVESKERERGGEGERDMYIFAELRERAEEERRRRDMCRFTELTHMCIYRIDSHVQNQKHFG